MEHEDGGCKADGVYTPESVGVMSLDDLQDAGSTGAAERLRIRVLLPALCEVQRIAP
jgi:hypothetical protein